MFQRLIELIKDAIRSMVAYQDITDVIKTDGETVSSKMTQAFDEWQRIYKNQAPWLNSETGIVSLAKAKKACEAITTTVLNEYKFYAIPEDYDVESGEDIQEDSRAAYINNIIDEHLNHKLKEKIEYAFAMGGCIVKPFISNGQIYFDFVNQGDFYPIAFDDDGNITDIAFIDRFVSGNSLYTRIERHTFADGKIVIENKAFQANYNANNPDNQDLGNEIDLKSVDKWAGLEPEVKIEDATQQLFGYFRVANANNIDMHSPLGISLFANAINTLEKIDRQAARLDWEYDGGELAIDADCNALVLPKQQLIKGKLDVLHLPHSKKRLFRGIDRGQDDTYSVFSPQLRDDSYLAGLNAYLMEAEDQMGLSRGSLGARVDFSTKTATEEIIAKQMAYNHVVDNQASLEKCLRDVANAIGMYLDLYSKELNVPKGKYEIVINWNDSILTDRDTELNAKKALVDMNVMSKAELRAWYFKEPLGVAAEQVQNIIDNNRANFNNDLFGDTGQEDEGEDNGSENTDK